jgi:hypothetical protein
MNNNGQHQNGTNAAAFDAFLNVITGAPPQPQQMTAAAVDSNPWTATTMQQQQQPKKSTNPFL